MAVSMVAVAALSGCFGLGGHDGTEARILESPSGNVLVGPELNGPTVGVGFGGTVVKVGDCLGVDGWTVIWPHGTTIASTDPLSIEVPGLGRLAVGDTVDGGGNISTDGTSTAFGQIPRNCRSARVVEFYPDA
jgi:hypothetical protein